MRAPLAGIVSCVALAVSACATPTSVRQEQTDVLAESAREWARRQARCAEMKRLPVSPAEETTIGSALTLAALGESRLLNGSSAAHQAALEYLEGVGKKVAAQSTRPGLSWRFEVMAEDAISSRSTPGGTVLLSRGLLRALKDEAQLAFVLGHEIGHVVHGRALQRYSMAKSQQCVAALQLGMAHASPPPGVRVFEHALADEATAFLDLDSPDATELLRALTQQVHEDLAGGFTEEEEWAADAEALRLIISAGYNPHSFPSWLEKQPAAIFPLHEGAPTRRERLKAQITALATDPDFVPRGDAPFRSYATPPLSPKVKVLLRAEK